MYLKSKRYFKVCQNGFVHYLSSNIYDKFKQPVLSIYSRKLFWVMLTRVWLSWLKWATIWSSVLIVLKYEKVCNNMRKYEKVWESMRKYEKVWESMRKYEKVWESMRKYGEVWKVSIRKCEKVWERGKNYRKVWNGMKNCEKVLSSMLNVEKDGMKKRLAWFLVHLHSIFWVCVGVNVSLSTACHYKNILSFLLLVTNSKIK